MKLVVDETSPEAVHYALIKSESSLPSVHCYFKENLSSLHCLPETCSSRSSFSTFFFLLVWNDNSCSSGALSTGSFWWKG